MVLDIMTAKILSAIFSETVAQIVTMSERRVPRIIS